MSVCPCVAGDGVPLYEVPLLNFGSLNIIPAQTDGPGPSRLSPATNWNCIILKILCDALHAWYLSPTADERKTQAGLAFQIPRRAVSKTSMCSHSVAHLMSRPIGALQLALGDPVHNLSQYAVATMWESIYIRQAQHKTLPFELRPFSVGTCVISRRRCLRFFFHPLSSRRRLVLPPRSTSEGSFVATAVGARSVAAVFLAGLPQSYKR